MWHDLDLDNKPYKSMRFHASAVRAVRFHPGGPPLFADTSDDGTPEYSTESPATTWKTPPSCRSRRSKATRSLEAWVCWIWTGIQEKRGWSAQVQTGPVGYGYRGKRKEKDKDAVDMVGEYMPEIKVRQEG